MAAEDANTHRPEQLRPYSVLEALQEKELMPLVKERTPSGNISVKPHSLSEKVSSKSWKEKWKIQSGTAYDKDGVSGKTNLV